MNDSRKLLSETHPHLDGFRDFLADLNKETERGAALAAAATSKMSFFSKLLGKQPL